MKKVGDFFKNKNKIKKLIHKKKLRKKYQIITTILVVKKYTKSL
jgi:hypothetical protein